MSLGENICRLRTGKNMSQGDLAEALDVSRQSISKWETDASTPELDKLVRLAELFGVTLDELVTGEPPARPEPEPAAPEGPPPQAAEAGQGVPVRTAAAIVLFCMAFAVWVLFTVVGQFLSGVVLALPFLVCGAICAVAKKHPWLWCVWALYLMAVGYLRTATGISWSAILFSFQWTPGDNYFHLATAWCQFLGGLALMAATVFLLRRGSWTWDKHSAVRFCIGCAAFVLLGLPWTRLLYRTGAEMIQAAALVNLISWLSDSARLGLLTAGLTVLVRWRRSR